MKKTSTIMGMFFLFSFCVGPAVLFGEIITEVEPDGTLTLESGKKVMLAGVQMDEEGSSVLRVLARKQDIRIEILKNVKGAGGWECAYAYLKAKSMKVPFKNAGNTGEKEIMLNEFLVSVGAARVDETQDFSKKKTFLKAQEEAKKKGEGVWSYAGS